MYDTTCKRQDAGLLRFGATCANDLLLATCYKIGRFLSTDASEFCFLAFRAALTFFFLFFFLLFWNEGDDGTEYAALAEDVFASRCAIAGDDMAIRKSAKMVT